MRLRTDANDARTVRDLRLAWLQWQAMICELLTRVDGGSSVCVTGMEHNSYERIAIRVVPGEWVFRRILFQ